MTKENNNTIKWRVGQLEKNAEKLDKKVDMILNNHLPHINEQLSALSSRVTVLAGINFLAIITAIVFSYLMR